MADPQPQVRTHIDWEAVENAYRIGIKSLRVIAEAHGCTEGAIRKRAKKEEWTKDLSAKVQARTEELVRKAEVRSAVRTENPTERQQIEISAQVQTNVILAHRKDIPVARALSMQMLEELRLQTSGVELLMELGELMRQPDERGQDKRNELYNKVMALPGRATTLKTLADALKTLIALERQAFGLDDLDAPGSQTSADALVAFVTELSARGSRLPVGGST